MPRTAPTIDGTPDLIKVSLTYVDVSGDQRTISNYLEGTATPAQIEAHVAAAGAGSNANLYQVEVSEIYQSVRLPSAAVAAEENSVFDNIVVLYKESGNPQGTNGFLPAPIRANFIGDTDNVDAASVEFAAFRSTLATILLGTVVPITVRYTERREKNQATPALP
jgi:hypothetical protein